MKNCRHLITIAAAAASQSGSKRGERGRILLLRHPTCDKVLLTKGLRGDRDGGGVQGGGDSKIRTGIRGEGSLIYCPLVLVDETRRFRARTRRVFQRERTNPKEGRLDERTCTFTSSGHRKGGKGDLKSKEGNLWFQRLNPDHGLKKNRSDEKRRKLRIYKNRISRLVHKGQGKRRKQQKRRGGIWELGSSPASVRCRGKKEVWKKQGEESWSQVRVLDNAFQKAKKRKKEEKKTLTE